MSADLPETQSTTAADIASANIEDWCHLLDAAMNKIRNCVGQLNAEQVWWRPQPTLNSIANLMLHLAGNLRQWGIVGVTNGEDDRDRESEFTANSGSSADELSAQLEATVNEAKRTFRELTPQDLLAPRKIQGFDVSILQAISHTVSHFTGHTHQIIMLTRMILGDDYEFAWSPDMPRTGVPA